MITAIAWLFALLFAQQTPARESMARPVGTAVIAGTVIGDDASKPLRQVVVTLAGGGFPAAQEAVTDDAGRFAFADLPAGTYTLTAARPGFLRVSYGEKRPGGAGVPLVLGDGQHLTTIALKMLHGSAITGVLRTASGQLMAGFNVANVQIKRVQTVNGERRASSVPYAPSMFDDRGVYRIYGLPPGDYVVSAIVTTQPARQMTPEEIQWGQQAIQQASSNGSSAAPSAVGSSAPSAPLPETGRMGQYASVYYPGTVDLAAASILTLGAGEERSGIDFTLQWVHTSKIAGTVLDPSGRPAGGVQVSVRPALTSQFSLIPWSSTVPTTASDGTFVATGIPPGGYTLSARTTFPADGRGGARGGGPLPIATAATVPVTPSLWAMETVIAGGDDIGGITLRLQPGMTVSGKVVFAGALSPPADLTRVRVALSPVTPPTANANAPQFNAAALDADGGFAVTGMAPGPYRVSITVPGTPPARGPYWVLKSIIANRRDVIDLPIEIRPQEDVAGIVATFTDAVTELMGAVIDSSGHPTSQFPIVVFPAERASWAGSRFIRQVQPAADGTFSVRGLPPGSYYLSAVTDLDGIDLTDLGLLDQLAAASIRITLANGETKRQDVRIGPG